jgi:hypothetical protein
MRGRKFHASKCMIMKERCKKIIRFRYFDLQEVYDLAELILT